MSTRHRAYEIESCLTDAEVRPTITTPEHFAVMPVSSMALDLLLIGPKKGRWTS